MKLEVRHIVAVVLLFFAWKGSTLKIDWPPAPHTNIDSPAPDKALLAWADPVRKKVNSMLPGDRQYMASFYDSLAFILLRDKGRDVPIIGTTEQFANFHAGSLQAAIDKAKVGKYPGLGEAIDETFVNAIGADIRRLDDESRTKLTAACGVLSYVFAVKRDE